ncbi:MAG TPA: hypothetical protein VF530_02760 [Planctomycetota bacterium]
MSRPPTSLPFALLLASSLLDSCGAPPRDASAPGLVASEVAATATRAPRPLDEDGIFYVETDDPAHPRVRYLDGQLALDGSCAIRIGNKLSRKVPPVYVNGQPVGFC